MTGVYDIQRAQELVDRLRALEIRVKGLEERSEMLGNHSAMLGERLLQQAEALMGHMKTVREMSGTSTNLAQQFANDSVARLELLKLLMSMIPHGEMDKRYGKASKPS